ncbi:ASPIC/UnbV domain-containing protein [Mariniblastus sp.]|nr:ASPIC/UnbV domain-containing protein [bacterium]MDA7880051.1 ASPIC/UnbV domain-containing protein [Mariniblastus sp.]MDA7925242.1 ASPIC/UnbV domain-containing protein [Mariniblastus sp.]MDB4372297.1 ASPIC/UnbV domain-containing protein [Mariniblastus sp.]MDB4564626.1 ASPIC/UnbV domain-containing protein [Mariniblastus sp.]
MRTDPSRDKDFVFSEEWGGGLNHFDIRLFEREEAVDGGGPPFRSAPFSGGERNRLFMQRDGNFDDMTLVSGIDFREDGRGFALFDYDRDGFLDVVVVSPNNPRFRVARNQIGDRQENKNGFVDIQLVGGHDSSKPTSEWSSRDAFGASVLVTTGTRTRKFELSCGEGLSSQNSNQIHIGMGSINSIDRIEVNWPSGKKSVRLDIPTGSQIKILERTE